MVEGAGMKRREFIGVVGGAAGLSLLARVNEAFAQQYPVRPITFIVPFAAGGPTDTLARILGQRMSATLGQTIVIENVSGATGSIGVGRAVHSAPDGYTLSIGNPGSHIVNGAIYQLPYDALKDLAPISMVASNPQLLLSKTEIPAQTFAELITWLKAQPRSMLIGTAGTGSAAHLSGIYLQQILGVPATMVPFRGTAPALQALMAQQIDILFDQVSSCLPQVKAKTVRAYAVTAKTALPAAPEIPTADAAGLTGFYEAVWHGLWAPKGTPAEIIARLNVAVVEALANPTVQAKLAELGQDIPTLDQQNPQALAMAQKAEADKWWPIIKAANIKPD
jgi:tripartite-type tricarboxylate transporter receptor subunit TctC